MRPRADDATASRPCLDAAADWFDGRTAEAQSIRVCRAGALLLLQWPDGRSRQADAAAWTWLTDAGAPRPVLCDGAGGQLVLHGPDAATALGLPGPSSALSRGLARSWPMAVAAVAGLVVVVVLLLTWLLPAAARLAAELTPWSAETQLGAEVLRTLDRGSLKPSSIDRAMQERIRARFARLTTAAGLANVRLHFRQGGPIGVNALALPGRHVIVTDELVTLLGDSPTLDAVLAHELGHVVGRHGLRALYARGGLALVLGMILSDPALTTKVLRDGSADLFSAAHSRETERAADAFAHRLLTDLGLGASTLADALEALQRGRGDSAAGAAYFGTHPLTRERIDAARAAR